MKKVLLLLAVLLPVFSMAQNMEGKIIFTDKVTFEITLPEGQEDIAKMIPTEHKSKKSLIFTSTESIFKNWKKSEEEEETVIESGDGDVQIKMIFMGEDDNQLYKNLETAQSIKKEDFFGKTFLITGDVEKFDWKLTGEQKKILGFNCQKATGSKDESKYVVWFTPEIPVSSGPDGFGQLPGMILEVNVDDGKRHLIAEKVDFKKLEKDAIEAPKKGKKVTTEEFDKITEEKMKEMHEEMGKGAGGGGTQIWIGN